MGVFDFLSDPIESARDAAKKMLGGGMLAGIAGGGGRQDEDEDDMIDTTADWVQRLAEQGHDIWNMSAEEIQRAAVDAGVSMGEGALSAAGSGLMGLGTAAVSGLDAGVNMIQGGMRNSPLNNPVDDNAQMILDAVGTLGEPGEYLAQEAGEGLAEATDSPLLGTGAELLAGAILPGRNVGKFDQRFDPRKLEQERLGNLNISVEDTMPDVNPMRLQDLEGKPFVTTMADRTRGGGRLMGINNVALDSPVNLQGGQDFMFNNPGQVWASAEAPVKAIMKQAHRMKKETGQDPLMLPWRMAPTGGDFASMTGETMLAHAATTMPKTKIKKMDREIKSLIPGWRGLSSPESVQQFRTAPDKIRKKVKQTLDKNFRNEGGLSIGEARLAVADPKQLTGRDAGIMNVGQIDTSRPIVQESGHVSYPRGVPGYGVGRLSDTDNLTIFDLLPDLVEKRGIPGTPRATDIRAMQMKPYAGIIDEAMLRRLENMTY
jgi:hypothetical protein